MPRLDNKKHEKFCHLIVYAQQSQVAAHINAGFKRNPGNASTLADKLSYRIEELKKEKEEGKLPILITDGNDVDENWIIYQLKLLLEKANSMENNKLALNVIQELAAFKGLGENNKKISTGIDVANTNTRNKINIQSLNITLKKLGELSGESTKDLIDITPKRESVAPTDDEQREQRDTPKGC